MIWKKAILRRIHQFLRGQLVDEENILSCFTGNEKHNAMVEYFELSSEQRFVVSKFIRKEDYCKSYTTALAYLASCAVENSSVLINENIYDAISSFNTQYSSEENSVDCEQFLNLLSVQGLREEMCFTIRSMYPYVLLLPPEVEALSFWSIMNECSFWSEKSTIEKIILDRQHNYGLHFFDLIEKTCSFEKMDTLIDRLLAIEVQDKYREKAENLLFQILMQYKHLDNKYIAQICDHLFKDNSITPNWINCFLRNNANTKKVQNYIEPKFRESLKNKQIAYLYAYCALSVFSAGKFSAEEAMDRIINGTDEQEIIINLAAISLAAWLQVRERSIRHLSSPFQPSRLFISKLLHFLMDPSSPEYYVAAETTRDLYRYKKLDNAILDNKKILQTAAALVDGANKQLQQAAECVLGILPLSCTIPDDLKADAFQRYRKALEEPGFDPKTIQHFRIAFGTWNEPKQVLRELKALYLYYNSHRQDLVPEDLASLRLLKAEIYSLLPPEKHGETPETALRVLEQPMTKMVRMGWLCIAGELLRNPQLKHKVDAVKMAQIIHLVHRVEFRKDDINPEILDILLDRAEIETDEVGSVLLMQWFEILCNRSLSMASLTFYQQFSTILNRPCLYQIEEGRQSNRSEFSMFTRFLQQPSRVELAIWHAINIGKPAVAQLFISPYSKPNLLPEEIQNRIATRLSEYLYGQCVLDRSLLNRWSRPELNILSNSAMTWQKFYDDRAVTRRAVKEFPGIHRTVLEFGYSDDLEIAVAAVEKEPASLEYLSSKFRAHSKVQEVLNNNEENEVI